MPKGGDYEREICKQISEWLTGGRDDDELWRSSQSGGRATSRAKKGKGTKGHAGDTVATGKRGRRLLKLVTMEIKRGYNTTANVHSLLDLRPGADAVQMYEDWFWQAWRAADRAGSPYWWVIHRRDRRDAALFMPHKMWVKIPAVLGRSIAPFFHFRFSARAGKKGKFTRKLLNVVGMPLAAFLNDISPETILEMEK